MLKVTLLHAAASAYHPNMVGEEQNGERNTCFASNESVCDLYLDLCI